MLSQLKTAGTSLSVIEPRRYKCILATASSKAKHAIQVCRQETLDSSTFLCSVRNSTKESQTPILDAQSQGLSRLEQRLLDSVGAQSSERADKRSLKGLYRAILVQISIWPDLHCRTILQRTLRVKFRRDASKSADPQRDLVNAKKWLITLQKANLGDLKALAKVIESAYGQRGSRRHELLQPIIDQLSPPKAELIPGYRRSRPPATSEKLAALWTLQFPHNKIRVVLPLGPGGLLGKPLDKRRQANISWRHHTALLAKTMPPIPTQDLMVLRGIVNESQALYLKRLPKWRRHTQKEMTERAERKTTSPHMLSARLMRRLYRPILARSPILYQDISGEWKARYGVENKPARSVASAHHDFDPGLRISR